MRRQRKDIPTPSLLVVVRKKKPPRLRTEAPVTRDTLPSAPSSDPLPMTVPATPIAASSGPTLQSLRPGETEAAPLQPAAPLALPPQEAEGPSGLNRRQREAQARRELLAVFQDRWPAAFPRDPQRIRPLMRGIHKELAQHLPDTSRYLLRRTILLFQRQSRGAYWQAVLRGGPRYALDGTPRGEVTAEDQAFAKEALAQRAAYRAARRSPRAVDAP